MRLSTKANRALAQLTAAMALAATLGAGQALAGEGGSWRYSEYLQQERAKAQQQLATESDRSARDQRATIGVEEGRGSAIDSGLRNSPYYFGSKPRTRHADR